MTSYRDHYRLPHEGEEGAQITHSWAAFTRRSLEWLYGDDRARAIRQGHDPATQADLARWNSLGRKEAA